jgi:site-specific recombinase XerC
MRAVLGYDRFAAAHDLPRVLAKIKRDHIEQYMADVQEQMKPASAATRYAGLRAFFSWALSTGEIRKSPLDGMRPPAVPLSDVRTVTEAQIKAMLDACKGSTFRQRRDYAIIRFLADSGCRRAEVAGLKVQDLNQATCQAVVTGKGSKTRTVVYSAATAAAIDRYMMARDDHTLASRTDALFLGPTRPLPPRRNQRDRPASRCTCWGREPRRHRDPLPHAQAHLRPSDEVGRRVGGADHGARWVARPPDDGALRSIRSSSARGRCGRQGPAQGRVLRQRL